MNPQCKIKIAIAAAIGLMVAPAAFAGITSTALPSGSQIVSGSPAISTSGSTETINLQGANAVVNWSGGFDIGSSATVNIQGSGATGVTPVVLNIDTSGNPSELDGALSATGASVLIANANGIVVGSTGNLNAPQGTLGFFGGTVTDPSQFASSGTMTVTNGTNNNAPLTINNGATVGGLNMILAGCGAVNLGTANYKIGTGGMVNGGYTPKGMQFSFNQIGEFKFSGFSPATSASEDPTTVTINGTVPNTNILYSQGNIQLNGAVSANYTPGSSNAAFANGDMIVVGGNIQGPGLLKANTFAFTAYGNINNPNGGGNGSNGSMPNHLTLAPVTAGSVVTVQIDNSLLGSQPQMVNMMVNGIGAYYVSQSTIQANGQPALNAGSHIIMQATQGLNMGYISNSGAITVNGTSPSEFSFPGLIIAVAGSNGNGTLNQNYTLYTNAPIDNAFTMNAPDGLGAFLQAGTIQGPVDITTNPYAHSFLNIAGNVVGGISMSTITGAPGTYQVAGSASATTNILHYRAWLNVTS